jgi:hypothetical protein
MPTLGFDYPAPVNLGPLRKATEILTATVGASEKTRNEEEAREIILSEIVLFAPHLTANEIDFYSGIVEDRAAQKKREATRKCQKTHPKRRA